MGFNVPKLGGANKNRGDKMNLLITGACYYDKENDMVLVPHFTGEYYLCDCTRYLPLDEIKEMYEEDWIEENKDNFITYNDKKYYYAEYAPCGTDGLELLSDLSELVYSEECAEF